MTPPRKPIRPLLVASALLSVIMCVAAVRPRFVPGDLMGCIPSWIPATTWACIVVLLVAAVWLRGVRVAAWSLAGAGAAFELTTALIPALLDPSLLTLAGLEGGVHLAHITICHAGVAMFEEPARE